MHLNDLNNAEREDLLACCINLRRRFESVAMVQITRVLVLGSYAHGTADEDSDLDIGLVAEGAWFDQIEPAWRQNYVRRFSNIIYQEQRYLRVVPRIEVHYLSVGDEIKKPPAIDLMTGEVIQELWTQKLN